MTFEGQVGFVEMADGELPRVENNVAKAQRRERDVHGGEVTNPAGYDMTQASLLRSSFTYLLESICFFFISSLCLMYFVPWEILVFLCQTAFPTMADATIQTTSRFGAAAIEGSVHMTDLQLLSTFQSQDTRLLRE